MRRAIWAAVSVVMGAALSAADPSAAAGGGLELTSSDIADGKTMALAQVFNSFGCSGKNVSPALSWSHAPPGTQSFALLVHDPDAPTGSGWWHWVVYDIPASATALAAGAGDETAKQLPPGTLQGRTDFGTRAYGGPCPPPGKVHHYHFRFYALKVAKLDVPADASAAFIAFNVHANALAEAQITALYSR
jgi:Raf kinase inhibitor-like YbhB/YbcL family protein